jgi:DNA-binding SARP family transcriptional activator
MRGHAAGGAERGVSLLEPTTHANPNQPLDEFALSLLGGWRLGRRDDEIRLPASAQRLVALVGLNDNVNRTYAAGTLWPEVSEQRAHGSLRSTIWRISGCCPGVLVSNGDMLTLSPDLDVDVRRLRRLFADMVWGPPRDFDMDSASEALYGDLLPGWGDAWLRLERERVRQMRVFALETITRSLADRGRYAEALAVAMSAVGIAPLRESVHREIIGIHIAQGNFGEAMRQFTVCEELLRSSLGLQPSGHMIDLMRRVPGNRELSGSLEYSQPCC